MPWEPMSREQAAELLKPTGGSTDREGFARILEAMMVAWGDDPEHIREVLEAFLGRPVE